MPWQLHQRSGYSKMGGSLSIGPICYLMTFLAFGLMEAHGLLSRYILIGFQLLVVLCQFRQGGLKLGQDKVIRLRTCNTASSPQYCNSNQSVSAAFFQSVSFTESPIFFSSGSHDILIKYLRLAHPQDLGLKRLHSGQDSSLQDGGTAGEGQKETPKSYQNYWPHDPDFDFFTPSVSDITFTHVTWDYCTIYMQYYYIIYRIK